jgi:tetratricopeptide (TPR) repeat protein
MSLSRRRFVSLSLGSALSMTAERLLAQGVATHTAKPLPRQPPSGRPFEAHFVDVAAAAGLRAPTIYGDAESKKYILEATGCGCLYLDFANIAFAHESFQVGIDVISEGLLLQPRAAQLYVARGVLYVQLAQYDKAEADFEKAYELDPHQSLSTAAQGLAAVQTNDLDHALAAIRSKLERKPDDALLLYLQADVLSQKGAEVGTPDFELAMGSTKRAVGLQPTLGAARELLAKLYLQAGQYAEAVEQCREALKSDPKDQTALYRLIQALRKTGQKSEIPELLKRLAELREQATKEERGRYRYKLIEDDPPAGKPVQP